MDFKYQDLGLKEEHLYEVLATTISSKEYGLIPNTSCVGIRISNNQISIKLYHNTKTYHNLKSNSLICINFVENIYLYALAALKGPYLPKKFSLFPNKYYDNFDLKHNENVIQKLEINQFPYIKESWALIICKTHKILNLKKDDAFGTADLSEFVLDVFFMHKFKDSYKLFNRAENLILEVLILTTRLKVAYERNRDDLIFSIKNNIEKHINNIRKFNKNPNVSKSINLIEDYIGNLN